MAHPVFTPTAVAPERLDELTVGSTELVDRLADRLHAANSGGGLAHSLVVGPRGSGKTHTLALALHRAEATSAAGLAVAWIAEDAIGIGSYVDLLVELIRALDPEQADAARQLRRHRQPGPLEQLLLSLTTGRRLVLVIENLDRVFQGIGTGGEHALRGFVETAGSVLILASAPLLFGGVSDRNEPWFGSFDIDHLSSLDVDAGAELIRKMAVEDGRTELAAFVRSDTGRDRLRAVEQLAGGSPRIWHILSGCIDVQSLDELIPAVEDMLDALAPYYQQRLWDLAANEQKLVVELARDAPVRTVRELAEATGMSPQVAATALGRLAEARWVRGFKAAGTDQRTTRYQLREPLLRHYLGFRDGRGSALPFIVEFLRAWYARHERRRLLVGMEAGSLAERHLVAGLLLDTATRSDEPWAARNPEDLLVAARCWIAGAQSKTGLSGSVALGAAVEAVVLATGVGSGIPRVMASAHPSARSAAADPTRTVADRVGRGLRALHGEFAGNDGTLLSLASACWDGPEDPSAARGQLADLLASLPGDTLLTLTVRDEHAYWTGEAGDPAAARDLYTDLIPDLVRNLGVDHADTLHTRHSHAHQTGEAGDPAAARDLYTDLIPDRTRALGPDHPDTLRARHNHAGWTGRAGDPATARDLCTHLIPDRTRALGPDHPDTLRTRHNHAYQTGEAGDPAAARDLYADLIPDLVRNLGVDHADTFIVGGALLRREGDPGQVLTLLGPTSYSYVAQALMWSDRTRGPRLAQLLLPLSGLDEARHALTTVLARGVPLPAGHRIADFRAAAEVLPPDVSEPLLPIAAALDGNAEAMAGLPQEMRRVAETLLALDQQAAS